jgi:adenine-specific DNA-methyltransferase
MAKSPTPKKTVETLKHDEAKRRNIPTAEYQAVLQKEQQDPIGVQYHRDVTGLEEEKRSRDPDLDPQLVWRGKDEQDWSELIVQAPPLYIQEKIHPKVLIDDLLRESREREHETGQITPDLFADFNGIPKGVDKTEFYRHEQNWSNRMILGDSLQVMASLAEREGLRGKVQCIYIDPPYGIKFNSNFQWSTSSRDVKDGNAEHITREPEQVKAFRDTWREGIHSYLTYLRDRLTVARDLLTHSGSIFVQIGDENVHRVRGLLDEVFGERNFIAQFLFKKTGSMSGNYVSGIADTVLWYAKDKGVTKFRRIVVERSDEAIESGFGNIELPNGTCRRLTAADLYGGAPFPEGRRFQTAPLMSSGESKDPQPFHFEGRTYLPAKGNHWKVSINSLPRIGKAGRIFSVGRTLTFKKYLLESGYTPLTNIWMDTMESTFAVQRIFVVQTSTRVIQRCILMSTDPGDLILDPTCGSGTSAYVAEQCGRRWITVDTSRVALALARARIMGARYPYYVLADSREGQILDAEITHTAPSAQPVHDSIRLGFVYERVPHITLESIGNNTEIDVIWDNWQAILEPLRESLNNTLMKNWQEWEIPREADTTWSDLAKKLHADWWQARIGRQKETDASIAAKAGFEYLYDRPYENKKTVRVAGPFTVESLSPHRVLGVDENDGLIDIVAETGGDYGGRQTFPQMILENLKTSGVQQAHKEDKITFTAITPWPGYFVCAEGRYLERREESGIGKRAAIFIGPEFGTVTRPDLVAAAREAGDAGFDVLIACAFNYEAHATEFNKLGRIPVLKARMNADLHMADDLKNTGKGNLFVIFGEPDIVIQEADNGKIRVKINGVDVFHPNTGEVRSDGPDRIACWFIDTDYNEESFFVRQAYFLGANDPYNALKTTLKAEINEEAWVTLKSDTSRPFPKPKSGRIAVKVINHLGDEVMKVFKVE